RDTREALVELRRRGAGGRLGLRGEELDDLVELPVAAEHGLEGLDGGHVPRSLGEVRAERLDAATFTLDAIDEPGEVEAQLDAALTIGAGFDLALAELEELGEPPLAFEELAEGVEGLDVVGRVTEDVAVDVHRGDGILERAGVERRRAAAEGERELTRDGEPRALDESTGRLARLARGLELGDELVVCVERDLLGRAGPRRPSPAGEEPGGPLVERDQRGAPHT